MESAYTVHLTICTNAETVVEDLYREAWQSDAAGFLQSAVLAARAAVEAAAQGEWVGAKLNTDSYFAHWHGGKFHSSYPVYWEVVHDDNGVIPIIDLPHSELAVAHKYNRAARDAFMADLEDSYRRTLADEFEHLVRVMDEFAEWPAGARSGVRWWIDEANGPRGTDAVRANAAKVAAALAAIK